MRKVVFVKGPQGSGKSTFIQNMGWEPYCSSMDALRQLRRAPELDASGKFTINQDDNDKVANEWFSLVEKKMERGEFLVLDATFAQGVTSSFTSSQPSIMDLVKRYMYDAAVVDFTTMPFDQVLRQNDQRAEHKRVSHAIIKKTYDRLRSQAPWEGVASFSYNPDGRHEEQIRQWVNVPVIDLSKYSAIIHIGDLQGCLSVLTGPGGVLEHGFEDDKLYVFVGDLLDRGIENGILMRWFVDHAVPRPNVVLIWGNHEDHIRRWAFGEPAVSDEFEQKTLPQLLEAGITPEDAKKVCQKAVEALFYSFHGHQVMVTHAGLPTVPAEPALVSLRQYSKGTGRWSDPIDEQFERNAPLGWVQVHGHRNHGWQDIQARPRSFNLEDQVEFGGRLRWATLSSEGWSVGSNRNAIYELEGSLKIEKRKINWASDSNKLSEETALAMRGHSGVKERPMSNQPHIVSFNFTKDVFFSASWDDVVVKARGFFVNKDTHEVVSRGYDKFFNIGERPETQMSSLAQSLEFPVVGYVKENGYLGNIGYDAVTGSLFVATKSSSSGDFSDWFREILNEKLTQGQQEGLARWLRDNDACMTFEVIDPVRDPHMISYDSSQLVLLDVFHRSEHSERLPYEELKAVAKKFNLECKKRGLVFGSSEAFEKWYSHVAEDLSWRYRGQDVEGFVIEDSKGYMTKIKMAHYAFWKKMRGQKDRMSREWEKVLEQGTRRNDKLDQEPQSRAPRFNEEEARREFVKEWKAKGQSIHPAAELFLEWCAAQPSIQWQKSIVDLRDQFLQTNPTPEVWSVPYAPYNNEEAVSKPKAPGKR